MDDVRLTAEMRAAIAAIWIGVENARSMQTAAEQTLLAGYRMGAEKMRARIRALTLRAEAAERRLAVFNSGGFADADALAEKYLEQSSAIAASRERERALREMFKDGYVLALYDDHGSQVNAWHSPEEFIATIATPDSAASPTGGEG